MEEIIYGFDAVYDKDCRVLILGSMPSVVSLQKGFYYMHPSNRFWRTAALITGESLPDGIDGRRAMLLRHGIALWDIIKSCRRQGSLDSRIKDASVNDLYSLPRIRELKIFTNGILAAKLLQKSYPELSGVGLPSTSSANAGRFYIEKWLSIKEYL